MTEKGTGARRRLRGLEWFIADETRRLLRVRQKEDNPEDDSQEPRDDTPTRPLTVVRQDAAQIALEATVLPPADSEEDDLPPAA